MGLVRSAASLLMVGLLAAAIPGGSLAQESAEPANEDTGAVITEFVGVPWGAGETTVREEHGEPWHKANRDTSHPGGPWKVLLYDHQVEDLDATLLFGIRGDAGLVQGMAWLRKFHPDECETAYGKIKQLVQEEYPSIEAETTGYNRGPYFEFCESVRFDQAARSTRWKDPVNGVVIELTINDHASITLHYMTPEFSRFRVEKPEAAD